MVPDGGMVMNDADVLNILQSITWPPCETRKYVVPGNAFAIAALCAGIARGLMVSTTMKMRANLTRALNGWMR